MPTLDRGQGPVTGRYAIADGLLEPDCECTPVQDECEPCYETEPCEIQNHCDDPVTLPFEENLNQQSSFPMFGDSNNTQVLPENGVAEE